VLVGVTALCVVLQLAACGERVERICPTPAPGEAAGVAALAGESEKDSKPSTTVEVRSLWEVGPHADTDVRSEPGYDSGCDVCHAPLQRLEPGSTLRKIPSGVPTGQPPHEAGCAVCHPQEPGKEDKEIAWLSNPLELEYETVESADALCRRCHDAQDLEGHLSIVVAGVHAGTSCTDCHDPHTGSATCTLSGCHQPFRSECEPVPTHDKPHAVVSCSGCHAANVANIDWDPDRALWHSFFLVEKDGEQVLAPHSSHDLSLEVACERCHTPGDLPWIEQSP
jgi:hypothetical protein